MEDAELRNILFSIQGSIAGFQNDMSDVNRRYEDRYCKHEDGYHEHEGRYHEHEIRYCATQGKRKNYRT